MKEENIAICLFVIILLTSFGALAQECMFICADATGPRDTEQGIIQKLGEWGYNVTWVPSSDLSLLFPEDYAAYSFAFASESVNSSSLAPLKLMPVSLVNSEAWASKPSAFAWCDPASAVNVPPEPVLIEDKTNHPLAAGYKEGDLVDLVTDPAGLMITTVPTIDVIYVGASSSDPTASFIYGVEKGTELTDGDVTENRAVCIGVHEYGYASMTDAAYEFIHAAINWVTESGTGIEEAIGYPEDFVLRQNYPNPFNPGTQIKYTLPRNSFVTLAVFNLQGQEVDRLVETYQTAGTYSVQYDAGHLSSGLYVYQLQAGDRISMKKLTVLK
jgi:hypothetical protein